MNDSRRNRLLAVGIALLFPLVVEEGVRLFGSCGATGGCLDPFYMITSIGALAALIGSRISIGGLSSGLFFGGLVCIGKNYYDNWGALDENSRFWALALALLAFIFVALYKSGKLAGITSRKRR